MKARLTLENAKAVAAILLIALCCAWPLVFFGFPASGEDTFWHFFYAESFFHGLAAGELYPRWLPDVNGGLGAASFYFYGPVPYYLTSFVAAVTGLRDGLAILAATVPLILLGSGLAAYLWLRAFLPVWPAAVGAALYIAAPYHLTADLWSRGDFAEATAYIWIPLTFLGVEYFRRGNRLGQLLLPPTLALLAATHIIAAVLTLAVLGAYALVRLRTREAWVGCALAGAAGLAMAGIYLVPMALLQSDIIIPHVALDDNVFMLGPRGSEKGPLMRSLDLLFICELAGVVLLAILVISLVNRTPRRQFALTWVVLTAAMLLVTTVWVAPLWRVVPVYNQVQFPFRIYSIVDLGIATTTALLIAEVAIARPARLVFVVAFAFCAVLGAGQAFLPLKVGKFDATRLDWDTIRRVRDVGDAFRPKSSAGLLPFDRDPKAAPSTPKAAVSSGTGEVQVDSWRPGRIDLLANMSTPGSIDVAQLWFPLWDASSGGSPAPAGILPFAPSFAGARFAIPARAVA
jgi:uncharacterized membrane protein